MRPGLVGYILAGGRSSRMGQDKSAMLLGGTTLLELAARKLRPICTEVVVVGPALEGVRNLADRHMGCGPLGGIETALSETKGDWAVFLPVDMPLLPAGLLRALIALWAADARQGARVCFAVTNEGPQPLISLIHRDLLPSVREALRKGELRVRAVLESGAKELAGQGGASLETLMRRTEVRTGSDQGVREVRIDRMTVWQPAVAEWATRELWFSNLNTPAEFADAERLAAMWPVGEDGTGHLPARVETDMPLATKGGKSHGR